MVWTQVPVRTFRSLIIFQMGYKNVYVAHTVWPLRLVHCISTLPGTGQFLMPLPSGKCSSPSTPGNVGILCYIVAQINGLYFVCSLYKLPLDCCSRIRISHTYTCMMSPPASAYICSLSYRPTGNPDSSRIKDTAWWRL